MQNKYIKSVLPLLLIVIISIPKSGPIKCRMFEQRSPGKILVDKLDDCSNNFCCFGAVVKDLTGEFEVRGCEDFYRRFLDFMPEMIAYPWLEIGQICEKEKCIHVESAFGMTTNICGCKENMCNKFPVMTMWELWRNRSWEKQSIILEPYPFPGRLIHRNIL